MSYRMHDGRYAAVTSEVTPGDVFVSDAPEGPFEHLGRIAFNRDLRALVNAEELRYQGHASGQTDLLLTAPAAVVMGADARLVPSGTAHSPACGAQPLPPR